MPCKNGLIALDEEALPVISSRKKAVADVVVKVLSTYYKKRRIASKVSNNLCSIVCINHMDHVRSCSSSLLREYRHIFWTKKLPRHQVNNTES